MSGIRFSFWTPGALVSFMLGELVPFGGCPQFGNLMAARLVREA